jgi:uncharacterized protein (UPF0248 family)
MVHPLKNILNGLRWDSRENPEDYLITYRHRGAPQDIKKMRGSQIQKIGKSYFTIPDATNEDETVIPFHRILEIRNTALDRVVWTKRSNHNRESKA